MAATKTRLIPIGNSQGFRIPKPLLEQCGIEGPVEIHVRDGQLVIEPVRQLREGWADAFAADEDDENLWGESPESLSSWDEKEWEW